MPCLVAHLLLPAAAFSLASLAVVAGGTGYNSGTCQASVLCGANLSIHYPFFLANATMAIDAYPAIAVDGSYCGYPGMAITCAEKAGRATATLQLKGENYTVLDIDYDKHTVTVADADVLDAGDCPRVTHNVSVVPAETWLNLSNDTANENLVFFFDCIFAAGIPKPPPSFPPINCSDFRGREGLSSFVAAEPDVPPRNDFARACSAVITMPVLKSWLLNDEYFPRLNDEGYGKVLKKGFQLMWDPNAGPCYDCEDSGGRCSYSQTGGFLGCLCFNGSLRNLSCSKSGNSKKKKTIYIVSFVVGTLLMSMLLMCALYRKKFQAGRRCTPRIESFLQKHGAQHPRRYTYTEVKRMTKSLSHKLGQGGFGTVYKGNLPNGRQVAVKLLKNSTDDGQEFMNEVASIMRTSHVNVVALLGYCLQGSKRALIYEYMPNGSLERFAFGQYPEGENSLSWDKLFDITLGIAHGLEYLHRGCSTRIVHFDIKPHNILLDKDFCPKISDFGLAKLCMTKESIISIDGVRGTIGYIAPEVFSQQFGQISSKSDVYSYGMMVLELVGARKNINRNLVTTSKYFPQWIYEHLEEYCVNVGEIGVDTELVRKMIVVGLWCIQLQPGNRPTMTRVVEMLESRGNDLEIPPQSLLC